MNPRKIINFLSQNRSALIFPSKQDTAEETEINYYCIDKGYLKQTGNSYRLSDKALDLLKDDSEKALDIKILEYLKYEKATFKKIDIAAPFLVNDDDYEIRLELIRALRYLEKEKFIEFDERNGLLGKVAGQFGSKYMTGNLASITKLGEKEIEPPRIDPLLTNQTIIHGHQFSGDVNQSDFSNTVDNRLIKQNTTNTTATNNPKRSKIEVLYWVISILVGLIAIYWFLHAKNVVIKF